jgi:type VI secretion system secreted protein Hcp
MAMTVHAFLKANGKDLKAEPTTSTQGRADSMECTSFDYSCTAAREAATGMMTGRRQHSPIKIIKRIDKSSPLLAKALTANEKIDGKFQFYRPNPLGDGTVEQFYTVEISDGYVTSIRHLVSDTLDKDRVNDPPLEEVQIVFKTITWTYMNGGVTHKDVW